MLHLDLQLCNIVFHIKVGRNLTAFGVQFGQKRHTQGFLWSSRKRIIVVLKEKILDRYPIDVIANRHAGGWK